MANRVCGDCRYFIVERQRETDAVGQCKFGKYMGVYPSTRDGCSSFARPGDDRLPQLSKSSRKSSVRRPRASHADHAPTLSIEATRSLLGDDGMSKEGVFRVLEMSRREGASILDEGDGSIVFQPRDPSLQTKDVPMAQFCNKLFMMHGNLRVLEQKLLTHDSLQMRRQFELVEQICAAKSDLFALAQPMKSEREGDEHVEMLIQEMEWNGLINGRPSLNEKFRAGSVQYGASIEEPIEAFFHRLCVAKDRLMRCEVLLEDAFGTRLTELQNYLGYIRKCYGTLKTFNILFAERRDYFTT